MKSYEKCKTLKEPTATDSKANFIFSEDPGTMSVVFESPESSSRNNSPQKSVNAANRILWDSTF